MNNNIKYIIENYFSISNINKNNKNIIDNTLLKQNYIDKIEKNDPFTIEEFQQAYNLNVINTNNFYQIPILYKYELYKNQNLFCFDIDNNGKPKVLCIYQIKYKRSFVYSFNDAIKACNKYKAELPRLEDFQIYWKYLNYLDNKYDGGYHEYYSQTYTAEKPGIMKNKFIYMISSDNGSNSYQYINGIVPNYFRTIGLIYI